LRAGSADLQHKLSVLGEFQHMAIVVTVAADPDESLVVNVDAVLVLEPVITLSRPAPAPEQIAVLIELHHWGRRRTTLGARWMERSRLFIFIYRTLSLDHPDMILRVDGDAGGLSHDPIVRQRFRAGGIDLELRQVVAKSRRDRKRASKKRRSNFHESLPAPAIAGRHCADDL